MSPDGAAAKSPANAQREPLQAARDRLFPPLKNKTLAQAANALAQNRLADASALLSGFVAKKPNDPAALNLMAEVARRSQRFGEAEQLLRRCVAAAPESAGYRFNHALALRRLEKFETALAQIDGLLGKDPRNPLYLEHRATTLREMGRYLEAVDCRRAMAELFPASAEIWVSLADSLKTIGREDECIAAYRRSLDLDRSSVAAYWRLADMKTYRFTEKDIRAIEGALTDGSLAAEVRANLHYALGKAYEDQKQYASSFDNHAKANALRRLGIEFSPEGLVTHRLNCEAVFTEGFFRARAGWGCETAGPIFIVGLPRSGSTLVEQMLSNHSAIEGLGELGDLDTVMGERLCAGEDGWSAHDCCISGRLEFRNGLQKLLPRVVPSIQAGDCRAWGEAYLENTRGRRATDRPFFTDKGLRNFGHVGLIRLILPAAKIVDVRRHPLDCAWSCFKSHFPTGLPFTSRLTDIGSHYANYARLMAHFDRVQPGSVHRVIYEKLIADPEGELRRLFDYLGLPFEDTCLRFYENDRSVKTLSATQVRKPLFSGAAQWLPYEQWFGQLKATLGMVLDRYPDAPD
ncbi:MAG TPA: sulfotransferase [Rhizomicrobium sp.]|jgi:tetratricopeptide (TPR) repeat protein|nr:sulfotransferase [Rhizomicrobium sp.]